MLIKCHKVKANDPEIPVIETKLSPIIDVDYADITDQMMGEEVVQIRVLKGGQYVNFWVRVGVNNQGRVKCEVATNGPDKTRRKDITAGAWRDQK